MAPRTYHSFIALMLLYTTHAVTAPPAAMPRLRENNQSNSAQRQLWTNLQSQSKFVPVLHAPVTSACEFSQPPESLTTPVPLINATSALKGLTVSFVIGADGLVHSALLLKSLGTADDRTALNAVRAWRYRPAMCNGVPMESEATVDFSSREGNFGLK